MLENRVCFFSVTVNSASIKIVNMYHLHNIKNTKTILKSVKLIFINYIKATKCEVDFNVDFKQKKCFLYLVH